MGGLYKPANKSDVGLGNVTNDAQLKIASNLEDVANQQTALDNVTNVAGAGNEEVLTKDTGTGNAKFKPVVGGTDEKAKVSATDTTTDYLTNKLVAGSNVTLATLNSGGNEQIQINSTGGGVSPIYPSQAAAEADGWKYYYKCDEATPPFSNSILSNPLDMDVDTVGSWDTPSIVDPHPANNFNNNLVRARQYNSLGNVDKITTNPNHALVSNNNPLSLGTPTKKLTVKMYFRLSDLSATQNLLTIGNETRGQSQNNDPGLGLFQIQYRSTNSFIRIIEVKEGGNVIEREYKTSDNSILVDTDYWLVCDLDYTTNATTGISIYLNGVSDSIPLIPIPPATPTPKSLSNYSKELKIGVNYTGPGSPIINGIVDEVAIADGKLISEMTTFTPALDFNGGAGRQLL